MCWHARIKGRSVEFDTKEQMEKAEAAERARIAEEAKRDAEEREARAFQKAIDEKVAKANRNLQLIPVEAR